MKIAISGINGRMGSFIHKELSKYIEYEINYGIDIEENALLPVYDRVQENTDVLIDFTNKNAQFRIINEALEKGIHVISGTTQLDYILIDELFKKAIKNKASLIWVPNFSISSSIFYDMIDNYHDYFKEIDLVESHSVSKVDRPSGTALELNRILGIENIQVLRNKRTNAIHEVIFSNENEKIILKHEILDRRAFFEGVLLALRAIEDKELVYIKGLNEFFTFIKKNCQSML